MDSFQHKFNFNHNYSKLDVPTNHNWIIIKPESEMIEDYTRLVKLGKIGELPRTCEFSAPIKMIIETNNLIVDITGKYLGYFIDTNNNKWLNVKLYKDKPEINFDEFKLHDVVVVELLNNEIRVGWFVKFQDNKLFINSVKVGKDKYVKDKIINVSQIKSIKKV